MKSSQNYNQHLYQALLKLQNHEEMSRFCRDLLTKSEIKELSARWQAAQMLKAQASYQQIIEETGLSSATIAKISRNLKSGLGGYKLALKRLQDQNARLENRPKNC